MSDKCCVGIGCRLKNSTAQAIPDSTPTNLTFDGADYASDGMHLSAGPEIEITEDGKYTVWGSVQLAAANYTDSALSVVKNGGTQGVLIGSTVIGNASIALSVSGEVKLEAGDKLTLSVYQTSGAPRNTLVAGYSPLFGARKVA